MLLKSYIYICWWHFFCDGILWRGYGWGWYVVDNSKPACIYNILPKNPKSNIQVSKSFKNKSATQALQTGVKNLYKMVPWKHQRLALLATTSLLHLTTTCFLWLCWRVKMCYYKMVMHWNHVSQHALQGGFCARMPHHCVVRFGCASTAKLQNGLHNPTMGIGRGMHIPPYGRGKTPFSLPSQGDNHVSFCYVFLLEGN